LLVDCLAEKKRRRMNEWGEQIGNESCRNCLYCIVMKLSFAMLEVVTRSKGKYTSGMYQVEATTSSTLESVHVDEYNSRVS
jgi:hypothetical protein